MGYKIDAGTENINKLSDRFFIVPDYQREYVWKSDDHVQRFLDDIYDEFDPYNSDQSRYFIGSIIIVEKSENESIYDVIDGQQRLTTIILTLCSIREILKNLFVESDDDKRAKKGVLGEVENILYKYSAAENVNRARLELQYDDSKEFLNQLIIENKLSDDQSTDSIKRMREAYLTIDEFLKALSEENSSDFLAFVRYFITKVELVVIAPDSLSGALKIFETINERGAGLNAMDLLKNLLFATANKKDFESIKKEWKAMTTSIEEAGESGKPLRFLRYFLMAKYHEGVIREDGLYKWISSNEGKRVIGYEESPLKFAKELRKYAEIYKNYIKATEAKERHEDFPSLTGIGHLLRKNSRQHLILLMALDSSFYKTVINRLASALEVLSFYYATNRVLTKTYERQFARWASKIRSFRSEQELYEFIHSELKEEIEEQRRDFSSTFGSKSRGNILPQYRIKFILGEIDNLIRSKGNIGEKSIKHFQSMEIEHILPQTPENMPKNEFEDEFIYKQWTERIGNLTLLEAPINQSIGKANDLSSNEWFETKLDGYNNSEIQLTKTIKGDSRIGKNSQYNQTIDQYLKSFENWDTEKIEERQQMLMDLMMEIWKLKNIVD